MLFGKPNSYLGVDLGAGGVKLVELKKIKKRPVLFTYGFTSETQAVHSLVATPDRTLSDLRQPASALPDSAAPLSAVRSQELMSDAKVEEYAAVIRAVCRAAKTVSKTAVVSLPVSAVFHAIVTLPPLEKDEFDRVLKAEVRKLLPYPLEETALDYQRLSVTDGGKAERVLINAVPRALVAFYSRVFQRAGLKLDSLEPESVALSRALVGRDTAVTLLIDIGAERTNFFIIDRGIATTHHSIVMGGARLNKILATRLGVNEPEIEQIKQDLFMALERGELRNLITREKFLELCLAVIDPIIKEIEVGFNLYLRQSGNENKRPEKIILTGGGAHFPYLADQIATTFKLKCYTGDPWGRVVYQDKLKPLLGALGPRMAVAIGLALRNMV